MVRFSSDWSTPISIHHDISPTKVVALEYINPFVDGWDYWLKHHEVYGEQGFVKGKGTFQYSRQFGVLGWSFFFNLEFGNDHSSGD